VKRYIKEREMGTYLSEEVILKKITVKKITRLHIINLNPNFLSRLRLTIISAAC